MVGHEHPAEVAVWVTCLGQAEEPAEAKQWEELLNLSLKSSLERAGEDSRTLQDSSTFTHSCPIPCFLLFTLSIPFFPLECPPSYLPSSNSPRLYTLSPSAPSITKRPTRTTYPNFKPLYNPLQYCQQPFPSLTNHYDSFQPPNHPTLQLLPPYLQSTHPCHVALPSLSMISPLSTRFMSFLLFFPTDPLLLLHRIPSIWHYPVDAVFVSS